MLMLINVLLLLLGTFMDMAPMILICTPIMLPVIKALGVDPVHFGMIMLLNLGIGLITPPVGPTLFVGCAIGKVTMEEVSRELWPFYGAMCIALLIVTYFPGVVALAAAGARLLAGRHRFAGKVVDPIRVAASPLGGGEKMARFTRRRFLQASGAGLAGILASHQAPVFAQASTVHWIQVERFRAGVGQAAAQVDAAGRR